MADGARSARIGARLEKLAWMQRLSLTSRILAVNLLPLVMLGGGIFYLDTYRKQLLNERYRLARIEAQITAEALAGATRERQEALLIQIGREQRIRLRMFDAEGRLWADSFQLAEPSFVFDKVGDESFKERFARMLDRTVDTIVGAEPIPDYAEPEETVADAWPELRRAREEGLTQIQLRDWPDGTPVINAAAPVGLRGATLLTTRNAVDITNSVRNARSTLGTFFGIALLISFLLSLYLARTILRPLQMLSRAAMRVRLGRDRQVEVPRLPSRKDEIGLLARAISDMTQALRQRIDAVEAFAADVAHELKNPLASLRSALDSLGQVNDPALRTQLLDIASHDVRRIDRLVTEIAEASRIDAELSRAIFVPVDMAALVGNAVAARQHRNPPGETGFTLHVLTNSPLVTNGEPFRLERVIENLLDNAVSFTPPGSVVEVLLDRSGSRIEIEVRDHGPGVPPDQREQIFARFHSLRPETESFGDHSGLGLAIARTIAEAHDGALTVQDRADGLSGASFLLELPARQEP